MIARLAAFALVSFAGALPAAPGGAGAAQPAACAAPAAAPSCGQRRVRGERPIPTWRQVATDDDRRRLREWRDAFVEALGEARASGNSAEIAREGALLEPDAALRGAPLPAGDYRCRTIKLGSRGETDLNFIAYPAFRCRVAPGADRLMHFTKLSGSQRPVGRLYAEHDRRQIFLGTMQLGDERSVLSYGRDRERNMAGIVERVGERRWRILFPYPHFESTLDVIELVPDP
jgi:hypothetical protein